MSNLITQNYYTTQTVTEVQASATGEISIQLLSSPIGEFGILIFGEDDNMEEIFFHRKSGNTIYTYAINRSNPKTHSIGTNVVMNDSAGIFNYLSKNVYNHFYCYKESDTSVFVFGGKIFKEGIIEIPNKSLTISEGMNYIYLDDNFEIQVSSSSTNRYTVGLVTKSGSLINITKYNILGFGKDGKDGKDGIDGKDGTNGTDGTNGIDGIDGKSIVSAEFNGDDIDFTMNDSSVITLPNAKIDLKGDPGDIGEPGDQGQTISDIIPTNTSTHTVTTDGSTFVKITENSTGNYVLYNLTDRVWASSDDEVSNSETISGTWGAIGLLEGIIYPDGLTIDTDGTIRYTGQPAYRDKENDFTGVNIFNNTTIFKGGISHPFHTINLGSSSIINFDGSLGENQKIANMTTPGAKTLNISNIYPGRTYGLAINNQTGGDITIVAGTVNSNGITSMHSLGGQVSTQTMATGSAHMLFMYASESGIHISYLKSGPF